jgi:PAS domain S-box-containing protein
MNTGADGMAIEELEVLKERCTMILEAAGDGIYGLDRNGCTTFLNSRAAEILGWNAADLIGKPLHDIHHHTHANGKPYPREECPIYAALKDGEVHQVSDEVFWHAKGHCVSVEYTSTPILDNGQPSGAVVVFRDISDRLRMEREKHQALSEITRLKELLELERDYLREEINTDANVGEMIGDSQALKRTMAQIEAVANTTANVLVLGESGSGKEMIARGIHASSQRAGEPLVKVNCASIPTELFESEFFGHVKGSFTGAHRDRVGRMELANNGTLFLDEVGEIPLSLQGKLLRALQESEFERVGDEKTIRVDVRIVAATNRDLAEEVKKGNFREDLYYRLSVFPIQVPTLRERVLDILPLAQHFMAKNCQQMGRAMLRITQAHAQQLKQHAWPGNIRELKNVMERAVILSTGDTLRLDLALPLVDEGAQDFAGPSLESLGLEANDAFISDADFRRLEKQNITKALRAGSGKVSGAGGAAELLGVKSSTLAYRISKLGIKLSKNEKS